MQTYEEGKKEAVKITRYNRVPDHLVGKVKLLKVDSAFLPDPRSVGAGAGKSDQAEAIKMVMKRKQEALAKQVDEGDESGKTREHLETKRRVGAGDSVQGRDKFQDALIGLLHVKERKVDTEAARFAMEERKEMSARLDKYMEYLLNPNIPEEIKANYKSMVLNLQAQLQAAQQVAAPKVSHSPVMTPQFTSPTHSQTRHSSTELRATSQVAATP